MLKEVGASGQISLGKRFAGQLFEMVVHADQRVELIPMSVVAGKRASAPARSSADWRPPGGYLQANDWALANKVTSWPSSTRASVRWATTLSVPP